MTATDHQGATPAPRPTTTLGKLTAGREDRPAVDTSEPILPEWLRDRLTFATTARNWAKRNAYRGGRFALHLPALVMLLALYAPRGLARLTGTLGRYLYDHDSAEMRHAHAGNSETKEYVAAQNVRKANLRARWLVAGTTALVVVGPVLAWFAPSVLSWVVGVAAGYWLVKLIPGRSLVEVAAGVVVAGLIGWFGPYGLAYLPRPPWWALVVVGVAATLALGWHGRPAGRRMVKDATLPAGVVEPLRADKTTAALCTLGNSRMKDPIDIRLLADPHRAGPGVQLDLELPAGVPASYVVSRREEFAAALRRELGCVWPSVGPRHPGHLVVFASDEPMNRATQRPWPLLKSGTVDLFAPVPVATDQRGAWVSITLAYANVIVGAVPRMGKTFMVRELLLIAGLDPRAKVYAIDGKGTGDLAPCRLFAHFYSVGDEEDEVARVLQAFRELRTEMRRRTKLIREMDRDEAPENKVTSDLANRRGLEPIVVGIDETQVYFEDAPKAVREELASLVTDLVKRGPALGIIVILATQSVTKDTIPTGISNNAVIRYCLKMEGHEQNDRVLGTGAYKRGIDAQMFDMEDKGIGYLKAEGDKPRIVRTVFGLDAVASEEIARRARSVRQGANRLTGEAAGEEAKAEEVQADLLADAREVLDEAGVRAMHLATLLERLTLLRPGIWGHLDTDALGGMLRAAGAPVRQVKAEGRNTSGVRREDLDIAATADLDPDEGAPADPDNVVRIG